MAQGSEPDNVIGHGRFPPPPSGSGPNDPTVVARLDRLEAAVDEIRKDVQAVRLDLARLDGKISNLPTTFQLVFMQAGFILAAFAAAFGLSFALLKLASPH
jgi:hypothetical protein